MNDDLERLWVYLATSPLLWLVATLVAYVGAVRLSQLGRGSALLNPVLMAASGLALLLWSTGTPYAVYFEGAQFVHFLLGPATVALAVPLYRQRHAIRQAALPVAAAVTLGSAVAAGAAVAVAWMLGASRELMLSLAPKSVTMPIAMGISEQIGGIPSLTAILVVLTGITGSMLGGAVLSALRVRDARARGVALGVTAHGIGTARAFTEGPATGAFASLGLGLSGLVTVILVPLGFAFFR